MARCFDTDAKDPNSSLCCCTPGTLPVETSPQHPACLTNIVSFLSANPSSTVQPYMCLFSCPALQFLCCRTFILVCYFCQERPSSVLRSNWSFSSYGSWPQRYLSWPPTTQSKIMFPQPCFKTLSPSFFYFPSSFLSFLLICFFVLSSLLSYHHQKHNKKVFVYCCFQIHNCNWSSTSVCGLISREMDGCGMYRVARNYPIMMKSSVLSANTRLEVEQ